MQPLVDANVYRSLTTATRILPDLETDRLTFGQVVEGVAHDAGRRSEEHTSELQSH